MSKIEEKVENLVKKPINNIGYELYDVEYAKEGKDYFLRIFIDNKNGISIEDCEKVNNVISDLLDEADYIKEQYFLEVSSPGIERVLRKDKHLEQNIGKDINIKLFRKDDNGKKEYFGKLQNFDKENITINEENKEYLIKRKDIAYIKTIFNW
ncbi:MAG: ribosome maturation factor RimP [Clostridia bacterium]|nr:ribosome maturation factor RimP [Clostridia bacterium]